MATFLFLLLMETIANKPQHQLHSAGRRTGPQLFNYIPFAVSNGPTFTLSA
jgi:hypothetical protein